MNRVVDTPSPNMFDDKRDSWINIVNETIELDQPSVSDLEASDKGNGEEIQPEINITLTETEGQKINLSKEEPFYNEDENEEEPSHAANEISGIEKQNAEDISGF